MGERRRGGDPDLNRSSVRGIRTLLLPARDDVFRTTEIGLSALGLGRTLVSQHQDLDSRNPYTTVCLCECVDSL